MNNLKKIIIVGFFLLVFTLVCAFSYVNAVSIDLANNVFRLHVIANSDSKEDQNLKYIVRDKVIKYVENISKGASTKQEIINIASVHLEDIKAVAQNTVLENGYNYEVNVEIGNFSFPTKTYGDISFPTGLYDALRIKIGNADGQNWWCVMFPPLCFVDVTSGIVPNDSKETLKNNLNDEEYDLVAQNSPDVKFKFKIIEMLQTINMKLANK